MTVKYIWFNGILLPKVSWTEARSNKLFLGKMQKKKKSERKKLFQD